ncbi:hypothetical protein BJ944DRAFT_252184 [Cunninghamella echinulata]|nr:hypothetical protein BJ944DRAFT_252184 [Cunninghamella echinulata]
MTSLHQYLEGISTDLHSHKVLEILQLPSVKQQPTVFNHALQYLRIKALKGDVETKVKLSTLLNGQVIQDKDEFWDKIIDKREAALWAQSLYDRKLSSAMIPCLGLIETNLSQQNKNNNNPNNNNDHIDNDKDSVSYFNLVDTILGFTTTTTTDTLDEKALNNNNNNNNNSKHYSILRGDMCYLVGWMTFKGIGLDKDINKAINYFKMASELDHDAATYQLATMMEDKYQYPDLYNIEQSVILYEKMITKKRKKKNNNNNNSNSNLLANNPSSDINNTNNSTISSNNSNNNSNNNNTVLSGPDINALTKLARVYYEGEQEYGQKKDIEKAYQYARKVAEMNGEKYCQFIVGDILLQKKDIQQSIFWLSQSGQQGFPLAIETLSRIYFEGIQSMMIKADYEQAHEWCLKGDDIWPSGLGYCQSCLGDLYRQGLGVPKDLMKAFEYYQKAASQQDTPQNYARYMLGEMFYLGEGGLWIQNIPVAKDYYRIAANDQYDPAKQRLKEIEWEEKKQFELSMIPDNNKKSSSSNNKQWKFMSLFGGRKKVSV